jgi:alkylhydroperoxidase family enzyme
VADDAYEEVKMGFGESELVFLTVAVASINAWNRIAMAYRFTPLIPQDRDKE